MAGGGRRHTLAVDDHNRDQVPTIGNYFDHHYHHDDDPVHDGDHGIDHDYNFNLYDHYFNLYDHYFNLYDHYHLDYDYDYDYDASGQSHDINDRGVVAIVWPRLSVRVDGHVRSQRSGPDECRLFVC